MLLLSASLLILWPNVRLAKDTIQDCFAMPPWKSGSQLVNHTGATAQYVCKDGFKSSGSTDVLEATCTNLWTWSMSDECRPWDCYFTAPKSSYAGGLTVTKSNRTCIKRVTIDLHQPVGVGFGRKKRGTVSPARCHVKGKKIGCYTEVSPNKLELCDVSVCKECGPPPFIPGAEVAFTNSTVAVYKCKDSFKLIVGKTTIQCRGNGKWAHPRLLCASSNCYYLYSGEKYIYSGSINVTSTGHACRPWNSVINPSGPANDLFPEDGSVDNAQNYCRSPDIYTPPSCYQEDDRHLSPCNVEQCTHECGPPPDLPFSTLRAHYKNEFMVEYICKPGYSPQMPKIPIYLECVGNSWRPLDPRNICNRVVCPSPPRVIGAQPIAEAKQRHQYPDVVFYTCKPNFRNVGGSPVSKCLSNGTWSYPQLRCDPTRCYIRYEDGSVRYAGNKSSAVSGRSCLPWTVERKENNLQSFQGHIYVTITTCANYSCHEGDVLCCPTSVSPLNIESCGIPECQEMDCGPPPLSKGTFLKRLTSQHYPGRAWYTCKSGHHRVRGDNVISCQKNGMWEELSLLCAPSQCYIRHPRYGLLYEGNMSVSSPGHQCEMWSKYQPNEVRTQFGNRAIFYQQSVSDASNFCRGYLLPGGFITRSVIPPKPWCYTNDSRQLWDFCDIPECLDVSSRKPKFQKGGQSHFTVPAGMTVVLRCRVQQLGDHSVIWSSKYILFTGERKSHFEKRYMLIRKSKSQWDLCIQNVRFKDKGTYRCVINTNPQMSRDVKLIVEASPCSTDEFSCPDRKCLPRSKQCDGKPDCTDESDEKCCNRCHNVSCSNGGTTIASTDSRKCCQCPVGLTGTSCEECDEEILYCKHGRLSPRPLNGTCFCKCTRGYSGAFCQFKDDAGNNLDLPREQQCSTSELDVVFILDPSSISEEDLLEFVRLFIDLKSTVPGSMNIAVCISCFTECIPLSLVFNTEKFISSITTLPQCTVIPLEDILQNVYHSYLSVDKNRPKAPDIIIIIANDNWNLSGAVGVATNLMHNNVHLMVVTPEARAQVEEIASHPDAIITTGPFTEFSPFKAAQKAVLALCFECDKGWFQAGSSCYRLFTKGDIADEVGAGGVTGIKWTTAEAECRKYNSKLVSINSVEEEASILQMGLETFNGLILIGLTRDHKTINPIYRTMFRWVDGKPPVYDKWASDARCWNRSQPDGAHLEACAAWDLRPTCSGWVDIGCANPVGDGFICEAWSRSRNETSPTEMPLLVPPQPKPLLETFDKKSVFTCESGEMVSLSARCDTRRDCRDGDDELNCTDCTTSDTFRCSGELCIPIGLCCNFIKDCPDGKDEDCTHPECSLNEWRCGSGECINEFRRCNLLVDCHDRSDELGCDKCLQERACFDCYDGSIIPTPWLCDGTVDCPGQYNEDETRQACNRAKDIFGDICGTSDERFLLSDACDGKSDCNNGYDETEISCESALTASCNWNFGIYGLERLFLRKRNFRGMVADCSNFTCAPNSLFFKCPGAYCIPPQLVCNGVDDCPQGEDEYNCDKITCDGMFRCASDTSCIHMNWLFDGETDCPLHDDESYYHAVCSATNCSCRHASITCTESDSVINLEFHKETRKISISRVGIKRLNLFEELHYLAELILTDCGIKDIPSLKGLFNLLLLDLSHNKISTLPEDIFKDVDRLQYLYLQGNRDLQYLQPGCCEELENLLELKIDQTGFTDINSSTFRGLRKLRRLSVTGAKLVVLHAGAFRDLANLRHITIKENPHVQFEQGVYTGLSKLSEIETDNFYLCCDDVRPESVAVENCKVPNYGLSSCADLMQRDSLKFFVWILSTAALFGNLMSLCYRLVYDKETLSRGYGIFVSNLGFSDFIMGVYMMIIAAADSTYRGEYMWKEYIWRHSWVCQLAGFLSTLSCEASTLFICLITLDRLLVIKYPFSQIKFKRLSAITLCVIVWLVCIVLASIPLLPWFDHWELYSRNSVCLALPLMDTKHDGQNFSIGVFIVLNFVAFLFIAAGQAGIYKSMRTSSLTAGQKRNSQDLAVAKKLSLIVITDFLCWFPICVMGLLAATGTTIPRETYAWTAVFVLPINSALNPFLYTLISAMQRRVEKLKGTKATSSRDDSVTVPKVSFGFPDPNLVSLRSYVDSEVVSERELVRCFGQIISALPELQVRQKNHQQLTVDNIYVTTKRKDIETVCFSVDEDRKRGITDDVMAVTDIMRLWSDEHAEDGE